METPKHCSEALRSWIDALTSKDREQLKTWGISSSLLCIAKVEVNWHLLCAVARFWKPTLHVFRFGQAELTITLEEVRRICGLSPFLPPPVFFCHASYAHVVSRLTGNSMEDCEKNIICRDGSTPMIRFDNIIGARSSHPLWLFCFVLRFFGELIFSHGRTTVPVEVAEIALAVTAREIDFYGCGALVQVS